MDSTAAAYLSQDQAFWTAERAAEKKSLQQLFEVGLELLAQLPEVAAPAAASGNNTAAKTAAKQAVAADVGKMMASLKHAPVPKAQADLAPMYAMLEALDEQAKDKITELNAHEEESKKRWGENEANYQKELEHIKAQKAAAKIGDDLIGNFTEDNERFHKYWKRVRDRQHSSFKAAVANQHAMRMKVKKMMGFYEKAMSGRDDPKMREEVERLAGPTLALMQDSRRAVKDLCEEVLLQIKSFSRVDAAESGRHGLA